jgi:hypothetical protein|tara:strand:- start:368 stop:547 length:180 start_codon:yes stop_codon:yes gene_type:complete
MKFYEIKFLVDTIIDITFIKAVDFSDAVKQANYFAGLCEDCSVNSVYEVEAPKEVAWQD